MNGSSIHPTAALVMRWSEGMYPDGPLKEYYCQLDMSSGASLLERCERQCPWYDEVIKNRRHAIRELVSLWSNGIDGTKQLVVLGAGMSPLSLEMVMDDPNIVAFDVDINGMREKGKAMSEVAPSSMERMNFLEANITDPVLFSTLMRHGWDLDMPSLAILGGISYYIPNDELSALLGNLAAFGMDVVMEYLVPTDHVVPERRSIPGTVFDEIMMETGWTELTTFGKDDLETLMGSFLVDQKVDLDMKEMEWMRTGRNIHFLRPDDGWIRCALYARD